ncbi:MAG: hypothetical protein H6813_02665 [Phycisphaeraceae bacterium]|nr:hypothetical protein [Phycisphaeraceae bacterium]MCB9848781.1 hypothetical protein [Phycisphaeraceae bacterium]
MTNDHESFLQRLDAKRSQDLTRWAETLTACDPNDLPARVHEVLDLAYSRGFERACIVQAAADATRTQPPQAPPPTRITCPACGRDIETRLI